MAISDSDFFLVANGTTNYKTTADSLATYINSHSTAGGGGGGFDPTMCPFGITQVPQITTNAQAGNTVAVSQAPQGTKVSTPSYQWYRKPWILNQSTIKLPTSDNKNVVYLLEAPDTPVVYACLYHRAGGGSTFADNARWTVYQSTNQGLTWSRTPGIGENENGQIEGAAIGKNGILLLATQQAYKFGGNDAENRAELVRVQNGFKQTVKTSNAFQGCGYIPSADQFYYPAGSKIYYSSNATNWASSFDVPGQIAKKIIYFPAAGKYICIGSGGYVSYSDSLTFGWSTATSVSPYNFEDAHVSGDKCVAVGAAGLIAWTNNGINWNVVAKKDSYNMGAITADNGYFIATKANSGLAMSHDGVTWVHQNIGGGTRGIQHLSFGLILGKYDSTIAFCQQSTNSSTSKFQAISGATSSAYTLTAADVGSKVFVRATMEGVTSDSNDTNRVISSNGTRSIASDDIQTFKVTVEDIGGGVESYFIDGVQAPAMGLTPDYIYVFDLSDPSNLGKTFEIFSDVNKTNPINDDELDDAGDETEILPIPLQDQYVGRSVANPGEGGAFFSIRIPSEAKEWIETFRTIFYEAVEADGLGGSITLLPGSAGTIASLELLTAGNGYTDGTYGLTPGDATVTVTVTPDGNVDTIVVDDPGTGDFPYSIGDTYIIEGGNNDATVEVLTVNPY